MIKDDAIMSTVDSKNKDIVTTAFSNSGGAYGGEWNTYMDIL